MRPHDKEKNTTHLQWPARAKKHFNCLPTKPVAWNELCCDLLRASISGNKTSPPPLVSVQRCHFFHCHLQPQLLRRQTPRLSTHAEYSLALTGKSSCESLLLLMLLEQQQEFTVIPEDCCPFP
jgi:hypothetical protein